MNYIIKYLDYHLVYEFDVPDASVTVVNFVVIGLVIVVSMVVGDVALVISVLGLASSVAGVVGVVAFPKCCRLLQEVEIRRKTDKGCIITLNNKLI